MIKHIKNLIAKSQSQTEQIVESEKLFTELIDNEVGAVTGGTTVNTSSEKEVLSSGMYITRGRGSWVI
jgi:hypothetical protein